ncbi:MAG TPA: ATP-binding protein [Fimbriimonadaceae bacterium]|nr:ATP-binding protein [Fimbriimonadaceae bacterium]
MNSDIPVDREAELARARLVAVVESSDDAIVTKSLEGIVTSWNKGAERIFGFTAEEIIGKSILTIIPPERHHEEPVILAKIAAGERIDHFETVRMAKDGSKVHISLTVSPIKDFDGNIVGISKIARDISSRLEAESAIRALLESERAARRRAEKLGTIKDEFLATLSHELRTPLNSILGWIQLIRRNPGNEKVVAEGIEVVERNARIQTSLISDLLDISRVISGKMILDIQRVSLPIIVDRSLESVRSAANAKGIEITTQLDHVPDALNGDPARLQQILWNLLSNAIKFTPRAGSIAINLRRIGSYIEVSISDTGIGIKPEFLPHLFERFSQQDSSHARVHGGLGIGLALVKHLAELHGGSVRASSPGEGLGATFTVTLPLAVRSVDNLTAEDSGHESDGAELISHLPDLSGVRVLIVDDEPDALNLVDRVLKDSGAENFLASSAAEARTIIATETIDAIVCDIGMPVKDGYQFIRDLRNSGIQIPAAALTAFARPVDRTKALLAGYQFHVSKPVDVTELIVTVARLAGLT